MNLFATFKHTAYAFPAVTVTPAAGGTVTKAPNATSYYYGDVVTLTATPKTGYVFDHWEGSCTGTTSPCVVTVDGPEAVTAVFKSEYRLSLVTTGLGNIVKNPDKPYYNYNEVVTLTPAGAEGWTFQSWSGDLTGSTNPATVTMSVNKDITATFTQTTYTLGVTTSGQGLVSMDPQLAQYASGQTVTLTPNPAPGWTFTGWGDACSGSGACVVTMDGNKSVTASFSASQYTFDTSTVGQGTINKSPDQTNYLYGDVVTLTAAPNAGWTFTEWGGACAGSSTCVVTVDGNESATATFVNSLGTRALTVTSTGSGAVTQSPLPPYNDGAVVTLTPVPADGWHFVEWTGGCTGSGACSVTLDADKAVGATFEINTQTLTVTQVTGGSVAPTGGEYPHGAIVMLTATPAANYHFTGWTGDCEGQGITCRVIMNGDQSTGAVFAPDRLDIVCHAASLGRRDQPGVWHL